MRLTDDEQAMRAGAFGPAVQWAIEHQIKVGRYFGADDFVPVAQAHIMADTESLGVAGVEWLERWAALPAKQRRVRIPTITDPRGTDFASAHKLKHQPWMLELERRAITALGALGGIVGRLAGDYWQVPALVGLDRVPTSDEMKHFGAALASYGSVALFHMIGITPEAQRLDGAVPGGGLRTHDVGEADVRTFQKSYAGKVDNVDLVVFSAPQLSLIEMQRAAALLDGKPATIPLLAVTSPQVKPDADRMGLTARIENAGGTVLAGMCFYQSYAREMAEANGWKRLATNSAKLTNILGGYGYRPALLSMEQCVEAACAGGKLAP